MMYDVIETTDEICGHFRILQAHPSRILLWQSYLPTSYGTVSIYHASGDMPVLVYINQNLQFAVDVKQTRSLTVPQLTQIEVSHSSSKESTVLLGTYCISLHYPSPCYLTNEQSDE